MAGRFFRHGDRMFRPAQQCAPYYGYGVCLHEVLELTPTSHRERVVSRLRPRWRPDLLGMHTLNAAQGLSVIDLLRLERPRRGESR